MRILIVPEPAEFFALNFLHAESYLDRGDVAIIDLDSQANVMLMDDSDFSAYRRGGPLHYYGGLAEETPVRLAAPHAGRWHVVAIWAVMPGPPGPPSASPVRER